MDLAMDGVTAMVLGPGDELGRTIARSLSSERASTLVTTSGARLADLMQQTDGPPHWIVEEPEINSFVAARLRRFLADAGREPVAVVLHVDPFETLQGVRALRWFQLRKARQRLLKQTAEAVIAAIPWNKGCKVVLVYRLADDSEREAALEWLDRAMLAVLRRAGKDSVNIRVNAVLVGADSPESQVADLITVLCSPISSSISGAVVPMDNGTLARDYLHHSRERTGR